MKRLVTLVRWILFATGIIAATLVLLFLWRYIGTQLSQTSQQLLNPLRAIVYQLQRPHSPGREPAYVTREEVAAALASARAAATQPPLEDNTTLNKFTRLITLAIEDENSLQIEDSQAILESLSEFPPEKVEVVSLFFPVGSATSLNSWVASQEALLVDDYSQVGIATRSATLNSQVGTIVSLAVSTDFRSPQPSIPPASAPQQQVPAFTGQDLWEAVQTYRRAHDLPAFQQSSQLCTVASIRLNEQLELGKLDNHDGFGPRADAFFEEHPEWTTINENLAAGYTTATQTVEWGWDQSLGHKALIQSREYPYACTAANRGFAVLITGGTGR